MWYLTQVGRATSRLLNALTGGEGDTTFSAYSFHLMTNGRRSISRLYGAARVTLIDGLAGAGHCREAYDWHQQHGLFEID